MTVEHRGVVLHVLTATAAGQPMQEHRSVEVVPGTGIPGDRYATGKGHWSDPRWPDQQLTLVEAELAEEVGIDPILLRRNIVTRDVDLGELIGVEFQVGTAILRGVRDCEPCGYIQRLTRPGLYRELDGRGGLRAEVLQAGVITVGDRIVPR